MKTLLWILFVTLSLLVAQISWAQAQYMSAVQFAVYEPNPQLTQSSQNIVRHEFTQSFQAWPQLKGHEIHTRINGNEVIFFVTSQEDTRESMHQVVANMIAQLNGRVRGRGRSLYYETSVPHPEGGFLDVMGDPVSGKIRYILAQSVPLRDLLREMKARLGNVGMSYLIPGDCAEKLIDWNFGSPTEGEGKDADAVMSELALAFDLQFKKRNGTYVFTGNCPSLPVVRRRQLTEPEMAQVGFLPTVRPPSQVFVSLPRIAD